MLTRGVLAVVLFVLVMAVCVVVCVCVCVCVRRCAEGWWSVGGVVCVWCGGLRWFDASLTYLGVFAGRQVGGVRQLGQDGAYLGRGHRQGGAEAGGAHWRGRFGVVLTGTSLSIARARQLRSVWSRSVWSRRV